MDVAKVIVTIFITKIIVSFTVAVAGAFSVVVPISIGIIAFVVLGYRITKKLSELDETNHFSKRLIASIKEGIDEHNKITSWNMLHSGSYSPPLINGGN